MVVLLLLSSSCVYASYVWRKRIEKKFGVETFKKSHFGFGIISFGWAKETSHAQLIPQLLFATNPIFGDSSRGKLIGSLLFCLLALCCVTGQSFFPSPYERTVSEENKLLVKSLPYKS